MRDTKKLFRIFYMVVGAGALLSVLLALIFGGFAISAVKVSNAMFVIALILCVVGSVRSLLPFFRLKSRLKKMPLDRQVDLAEAPKLKWEYPVIAAGIIMVVLSYLLIFV